jgi:hypothetical protein
MPSDCFSRGGRDRTGNRPITIEHNDLVSVRDWLIRQQSLQAAHATKFVNTLRYDALSTFTAPRKLSGACQITWCLRHGAIYSLAGIWWPSAFTDIHVLATHIGVCVFHSRFLYYNVCGCLSWWLHHTQTGPGIIRSRRDCGICMRYMCCAQNRSYSSDDAMALSRNTVPTHDCWL